MEYRNKEEGDTDEIKEISEGMELFLKKTKTSAENLNRYLRI